LGLHPVGAKHAPLQARAGGLSPVPELFDFKPEPVMMFSVHDHEGPSHQFD
jgi:hypothetical protein